MDLKSFGGDVEGEVEVQRGSLRQGVSSPAMGRARLVKGTGLSVDCSRDTDGPRTQTRSFGTETCRLKHADSSTSKAKGLY